MSSADRPLVHTGLIEAVKKLARDAGRETLRIYDTPHPEVAWKSDNTPLTEADRKSNALICQGLEDMPRKFPIISEESKEVPYHERKDYPVFWLVDPLDGTREFIKRNGEFTVNIALISRHRPVLGVVVVPVTGATYWAAEDFGAFMEVDHKVSKLSAATFSMDEEGLNVVCSRSHLNAETKAFIAQLNAPHTVSRGSSLKFLALAEGKAHLYPRVAPTMEWDTAAAQCILEQAGGKVVHFETRQPLQYNKKTLRNPSFLATGRVGGL